MNEPVLYFDYAATTPVDERVIKVMVECLGASGNSETLRPAHIHLAKTLAVRSNMPVSRLQVW